MRLAAVLAALAACKDKPSPPSPPPPAPPKASAPTPRPSLPPPDPHAPAVPITIDDATKVLPAFEGSVILALKQTSDSRQVHGTWCMDGTSADDVARTVAHAMAQAQYTELAVHGDEKKATVTGERTGFHLSMVVSASNAAVCKAPAHYFASATIFR